MCTAGHSLNAYTTDNMLFQRLTQGNLTIYVLHIIHFRPEQSHVLPRHGHFYFRAYTYLEERGGFVIGLSRLWVNHASGMLGSCAFFGIGHKTGAHCWHHFFGAWFATFGSFSGLHQKSLQNWKVDVSQSQSRNLPIPDSTLQQQDTITSPG